MKTKTHEAAGDRIAAIIKMAVVLVLLAGFVAAPAASAAEVNAAVFKDRVERVPAAELPARAAEMVRTAKARERRQVSVQVVKEAVLLSPAAAGTVVAAICRAVPEMASIAAGTAAEAQPQQASLIARAAAAAAPAQAGQIVTAVCRAVPNEYRAVAAAVAEAAPTRTREVLRAVAVAIPGLKPGIEAALANDSKELPSVPAVLASVKPLPNDAAPVPGIAVSGPAPSQPGGVPPTTPPPGPPTPGPGPRGHRNYAVP